MEFSRSRAALKSDDMTGTVVCWLSSHADHYHAEARVHHDGQRHRHPVQTGMVSDCDEFYLVRSGDSCANIAFVEGISLTNFYAWNPAVGSSCAGPEAVYVCIGL
ncbi:hypothetical protein F5Y12DRAFT_711518 [Xylaria sp. FL1777]|nr:hypothetical protein F5Y12DRAFT_711518 [Xylaria sp. FL1777]